jgi:predicted phage terminase large subunit-like protein
MSERANLLRRDLEAFVRMSFRDENDGEELGDEPYTTFVCHRIAVAKDDGARLVFNLPPRHNKTTKCTVALSAWLLARNPAEKIIIITYSEQLARDIGNRVRKILQSPWYRTFFPTRIADDRKRADDFATTAGGSFYAASVEGSFIGRGATIIIFDDPLDMDDAGNLKQIEKVNQRFDTAIFSRLNNPNKGRVVIVGHRLHEGDLSGHELQSGGWEHIALPFIAPRDQDYDLGGGRTWHRKKGELLRPNAFSQREIERIKNTINPDFEALYQQFLGEGHSIRISRDHFGSFTAAPDAPVVISVDPGHRPGPNHSFTVMQAWCALGHDVFLLDEWRAQTDVREASQALIKGTANCQAAAVLIEWSGYGQALAENLRRRFPLISLHLIPPDGRSKVARVLRHIELIQSGRIKLPQDADWYEDYVSEFEQFPHPPDDQVDATTQLLDFMPQYAALRKPRTRVLGARPRYPIRAHICQRSGPPHAARIRDSRPPGPDAAHFPPAAPLLKKAKANALSEEDTGQGPD